MVRNLRMSVQAMLALAVAAVVQADEERSWSTGCVQRDGGQTNDEHVDDRASHSSCA
jgi:hypothetical protein